MARLSSHASRSHSIIGGGEPEQHITANQFGLATNQLVWLSQLIVYSSVEGGSYLHAARARRRR